MKGCDIQLAGSALVAMGSGALYWPEHEVLCVSDLHLGKSERMARRGGPALPPYETRDTLLRLEADIDASGARTVICLGDSFDDPQAARALGQEEKLWITRLQAGRAWIWIEGNHDPGPIDMGGTHRNEVCVGPLTFRHIAMPGATCEISGHYHPKVRIAVRSKTMTRAAFLLDQNRLIMPAYGTYTGGLRSDHPALEALMGPNAIAVLTGAQPIKVPMPRYKTPAASRSG